MWTLTFGIFVDYLIKGVFKTLNIFDSKCFSYNFDKSLKQEMRCHDDIYL